MGITAGGGGGGVQDRDKNVNVQVDNGSSAVARFIHQAQNADAHARNQQGISQNSPPF